LVGFIISLVVIRPKKLVVSQDEGTE
jgi:hypothetical protein